MSPMPSAPMSICASRAFLQKRIVLYGESLGSGQATQLAGKKDVAAVILEAPLTSTPDVGKRTYFFLPLGYLITDQFRNIDHIRNVRAPLLVVHGDQDSVIPVAMGAGGL